MRRRIAPSLVLASASLFSASTSDAQAPDRLLRQPTLSADYVAFAHGGDLWVADREGGVARRLTATAAVEADPHFSPDGRWIAFTSDRAGDDDVYVVSVEGGEPTRLTWHPASASARGWTPDGRRVLFASSRGTAPVPHNRLWTVALEGGPSVPVPAPWGFDGSYAPDGERIVVDRMTRWDSEWRGYRGGQNTPLVVLELDGLAETRLPNADRSTDVQPVWHGDRIYFLSDREDLIDNVWSYDPASGQVARVTDFDRDVTSLGSGPGGLVIEQDGWIHRLDPRTGETARLDITVRGDFPWARARWEDVAQSVDGASPVWSPDGGAVAWFSDDGGGYALKIGPQDGMGDVRTLDIGESAMAWTPAWSPDGARIAFVDDRARLRVVDVESGRTTTVDVDGTPQGRGSMRPVWSPDSRWLAYARSFPNMLHRVMVWSVESDEARPVTDPMADAARPAWDRGGRHLWFLASTDVALGSGWANTSSMQADPTYGAYVLVLSEDDPAPFPLRSDEEEAAEEAAEEEAEEEAGAEAEAEAEDGIVVEIDFDRVDRRIVALPMPVRAYADLAAGPAGSVFIGERADNQPGLTLHKFTLEDRESQPFAEGVSGLSVSADGSKVLYRANGAWTVADAAGPNAEGASTLRPELRMWLDPAVEWAQVFDEAWRQERDYFYDPGHHGADWDAVYAEYRPLVDHVRHRTDLSYLLDRVNGELAVGHSFVFGGDYPDTDTSRVGLLGADLEPDRGRWRITRIYTSESWNPGLDAPLDQPGMRVSEGDYLLAIDGEELTADDDPFRALDGTAGRQTVLHVNREPTLDGAWTETVEPIRSEAGLRQRAWVEDNRRRVDELSDGRLAYVWVPNTSGAGVVSFNRYFFSQQDRHGAVIDERYNGGGLLDDYMVDLMTRDLRAAITNEAPEGEPYRLPAGILGPKVLLINERAGSGGDYFPWIFRQQEAGPLIGMRTWGGLVASCVHYPLVDGGAVTAPCSAVFEPGRGWIAENQGVPPDIQVWNDARAVAEGRDPQLERAVQEALRLLEEEGGRPDITPPPFSTPARPGG
ncbi:MAG: PDZ domain-containing protein [Gemmatimonadota bacterium]